MLYSTKKVKSIKKTFTRYILVYERKNNEMRAHVHVHVLFVLHVPDLPNNISLCYVLVPVRYTGVGANIQIHIHVCILCA